MFILIDNGKYITAINTKLIRFFFDILKVIFKSNSVSINKKNHIYIKCSFLNKTLHSVKSKIFSIKLWRKLTKFYPMTTISSYHESEIQFFGNHLPCLGYWNWFAEINDSTPPVNDVSVVILLTCSESWASKLISRNFALIRYNYFATFNLNFPLT